MTSENFLINFFDKLVPREFKKDKFLKGVYYFYKQEKYIIVESHGKSTKKLRDNPPSLFECYIDYLMRNKEFADDNEKAIELESLCDDIVDTILNKEIDEEIATGFISKEEKKRAVLRAGKDPETMKVLNQEINTKNNENTKNNKKSKESIIASRDLRSKLEEANDSTKLVARAKASYKGKKIVLNKEKALHVLSAFVQQSAIMTFEEPVQETTEEDEKFKEKASDNIVDEISNGTSYVDIYGDEIIEEARELPEAQPDLVFGQRSDMMNVWHDTESKCQELMKQDVWAGLISKLFFIDTSDITVNTKKIKTVDLDETIDVLPVEKFKSLYTGTEYKTSTRLLNTFPVEETVRLAKNKIKCIYVCTGSQMVIGGNADQGIDCNESMVYMTSTYSAGLARALHAYPLLPSQVLMCRNVLVFKNMEYKIKPVNQWQRIAVVNSPTRFRPALNIEDIKQNEVDDRLFSSKTKFKHEKHRLELKKNLAGVIELCLFFGYDVIILDDRAICDNQLPAHEVAKIIREVTNSFFGRVKEFIICISKAKVFNVFRHYF